ncbi:MAG: F0F1 ATP synthase subunit A [Desulfobacteraceae bacterium]|nr:MAG: F0F1 ATP synthase subunit A [Desulfobacteraceae bacterium]
MDILDLRQITPDQVVFQQWGAFSLNATIVFTWGIMAFLIIGYWLITRRLSSGEELSRWQNLLEILVSGMQDQIRDIAQQASRPFLPFVGTLFLFILVCNLFAVIPGYVPPTASLSTTAALAICVFAAVPLYGILKRGVVGYLRQYTKPTPLMLPFNLIGEISRTLALAVRLFGNLMSGTKIAGILIAITPLLFPVVMQALGLLTGVIQAYIFSVLAMVYIGSAARARGEKSNEDGNGTEKGE